MLYLLNGNADMERWQPWVYLRCIVLPVETHIWMGINTAYNTFNIEWKGVNKRAAEYACDVWCVSFWMTELIFRANTHTTTTTTPPRVPHLIEWKYTWMYININKNVGLPERRDECSVQIYTTSCIIINAWIWACYFAHVYVCVCVYVYIRDSSFYRRRLNKHDVFFVLRVVITHTLIICACRVQLPGWSCQ